MEGLLLAATGQSARMNRAMTTPHPALPRPLDVNPSTHAKKPATTTDAVVAEEAFFTKARLVARDPWGDLRRPSVLLENNSFPRSTNNSTYTIQAHSEVVTDWVQSCLCGAKVNETFRQWKHPDITRRKCISRILNRMEASTSERIWLFVSCFQRYAREIVKNLREGQVIGLALRASWRNGDLLEDGSIGWRGQRIAARYVSAKCSWCFRGTLGTL